MASNHADLGHAELEVLRALWDLDRATVREVLNHLHSQGRKVAYTTVLTFLSRLEQKGFVASDKSGKSYVYRALVSRENVSQSKLTTLLDTLYDGAAGPLVLQLVREERFTPSEINELQKLIDSLDENPGQKPKKRKK